MYKFRLRDLRRRVRLKLNRRRRTNVNAKRYRYKYFTCINYSILIISNYMTRYIYKKYTNLKTSPFIISVPDAKTRYGYDYGGLTLENFYWFILKYFSRPNGSVVYSKSNILYFGIFFCIFYDFVHIRVYLSCISKVIIKTFSTRRLSKLSFKVYINISNIARYSCLNIVSYLSCYVTTLILF